MDETVAFMKRPGKTASVGAATAITTIAVWALRQFAAVEVPAEIAAALMGLVAWGLTYFVPLSGREEQAIVRKYPPFREPGVSAPIKGEGK